ncbi:hypothetical protein [Perlucidibaca aquatica]|uniref:hypothetical protein n=1 Tax=Perlucidibaca aquatica TaxID=1852776 RepID=UPI0018DF6F6F|nr:hypothetical protein [Perlucidibaca aquatica]
MLIILSDSPCAHREPSDWIHAELGNDDGTMPACLLRKPTMQNTKQVTHELIDHLPEQATWDDVMYTLYVRRKLERSLQAANEGKSLLTRTPRSDS